jgi:hypothetical protein
MSICVGAFRDKKLKIGIDIHGVVLSAKEDFRELTKTWLACFDEVHVITGHSLTKKFLKKIKDMGIEYSHIFSITDYLLKKGVKCEWQDKNNPWFDDKKWNPVKGWYCYKHKIDFMFDDSPQYAPFFKPPTKFILMVSPEMAGQDFFKNYKCDKRKGV